MQYAKALQSLLIAYVVPMLVVATSSAQHVLANEYVHKVEQFLKQYERPFTVVCVGSAANRVGLYMAEKFKHATFVLMNEHEDSATLARCFKERPHNIVFLPKMLSPAQLQMLSECEHVDVVLAHDLSPYKDDWGKAIHAFLNAGDYMFITAQNTDEHVDRPIKQFLLGLGSKVKHSFYVGTQETFLIEAKKKYIERKAWGHEEIQSPRNYEILSDFKKKMLHKRIKGDKINEWVHGINLVTFYMLSGCYPVRRDIVKELIALKRIPHTSTNMNNIVIQGKTLKYIDFDRPTNKVSHIINDVIAAFKGEKIAYNHPKLKGKIRYKHATKMSLVFRIFPKLHI